MVGAWEVLANNSHPFETLRSALMSGDVERLLLEPIRDVTVGVRPVKQMTPNLRAAIVADYHSGLTVYELAQKHGLHRETIGLHLKAAGVIMRRTITASERSHARTLYLAGATLREIATQLHRDPATVKKMVGS